MNKSLQKFKRAHYVGMSQRSPRSGPNGRDMFGNGSKAQELFFPHFFKTHNQSTMISEDKKFEDFGKEAIRHKTAKYFPISHCWEVI